MVLALLQKIRLSTYWLYMYSLKLKRCSIFIKGVANAVVTKTKSEYISRNTAFDYRKNVCFLHFR